jgi:streptogramin lyase
VGERVEKIVGWLRLCVAGAAALAGLSAFPAGASAAEPTFFTLPPATHAYSMTAGPEDAIWFLGQSGRVGSATGGPLVGKIDANGQVKVFELPAGRNVAEIVAGPDGNLWFTETHGNRRGYRVVRVGHLSPAGKFDEFNLGNHVGDPGQIAVGPDGNLWFTSVYWKQGRAQQAIGRLGVSGKLKRFHLPPRSGPTDIAAGPDGNVWFSQRARGDGRIGRITPSGRITQFLVPGRGRYPTELAVGPDGNVWFGEAYTGYRPHAKARIGRIDMSGAVAEFPLPGEGVAGSLVSGPGARLWYTTTIGHAGIGIGSLTPDGVVAEPFCLTALPCSTDADSLVVGPDGALWFAASRYFPHAGGGGSGIAESMTEESEAGQVGRIAG